MIKKLITIYILLIILKLFISFLIPIPLGFSDSLTYIENAKSLVTTHSLLSVAESNFPFLFSLTLTPALLFKDMGLVLTSMKILGIIFSSTIIFPVYFLSKEFFSEKKSLIIALISAFIPPFFSFSFYILSENIFFPLSLATFYFLLKAKDSNNTKWFILAGVTMGLSFLSRLIGIIFFPLLLALILLDILKEKKLNPKWGITVITSLITILPLIISKIISSHSIKGILGYSNQVESISKAGIASLKLIWALLYSNYLILAVGVIFFLFSIYLIYKYKECNNKEKTLLELTFLSSLFLIGIAAFNAANHFENFRDHRIIGRYVELLIPLFIILGSIGITKLKTLPKWLIIISSIFLGITTWLSSDNIFFPINNSK